MNAMIDVALKEPNRPIAIAILDDNTNLLNKERFELMKDSAFLINTARGDVVDEDWRFKSRLCL